MYDRESDLKTAFNKAIVNLLNIEEQDYYSKLTTDQMLNLKSALSDINNIITLRLAFSLADWICSKLNISQRTKKEITDTMRSSKPNTNGYDIEISDPDIVAEIKCNIPINSGRVYGSAQRNGLKKDIDGLLNGKNKSRKKAEESIKILGLYDTQRFERQQIILSRTYRRNSIESWLWIRNRRRRSIPVMSMLYL